MFVVLEIQTLKDGSIATLTHTKYNREEAESTYHAALASGAISDLPVVCVILTDNYGNIISHQYYTH